MKKIIIIILIILIGIQKASSQVGVSIDFNSFYTTLSPYGRWVDYPQYGHIWICNEAGFRPYYNSGHWEYTSYGWTWISDYPWGWAPFHYGRWAYINSYGWAWVPGYDWGPAWVSWCDGGDYYGWAPLSPGLSINISVSSIPAKRWCFVPHQYINSPSIHNYYVDNSRNATIYRNVTVINNAHVSHNVRYIAGPRREDVERVTHTRIQTRAISSMSRPGRATVANNTVTIYRPAVKKNISVPNSSTRNTRPAVNSTHTSTTVNRNRAIRNNQPAQPHPQQQKRQIHQNANQPIQNNHPSQQIHQRINQPVQNNRPSPEIHQRINPSPVQNNNHPQPERMPSPERNPEERQREHP